MQPVSQKLVTARYIARLPVLFILAVAAALFGFFTYWVGYLIAAAAVGLMLWQLWLVPKQVARLRWHEAADELLLSKGKIWHTFTVVPYGRIQYIEVDAGPIQQNLGLATLTLHTASSSSDATLPGLPKDEAYALRSRLSERAKKMQAL